MQTCDHIHEWMLRRFGDRQANCAVTFLATLAEDGNRNKTLRGW
jgi:hypothetical protein